MPTRFHTTLSSSVIKYVTNQKIKKRFDTTLIRSDLQSHAKPKYFETRNKRESKGG